MNERIKELTLQTGIHYGSAVDYYYTASTDGVTRDDMEKFAELLIRECLDIVDNEGCGEGGSIRAMEKIKEHFGVRE